MKKIKLFALTGTAVVALGSIAWAGPHSAGGGFAGGGHFGGSHVGGYSGGIRAGPAFSGGGARFSGNRSIDGLSRTPQQFYYYSGARTSAVTPHVSASRLPNRSLGQNAGRVAAVNRQANRVNPAVGQRRVSDSRLSTAANRQSFVKNHAFGRHDANWHRDWDKGRAHFHHRHVFVFVDGFWWGLYPWDYYPYYADDDNPYDSYDYSAYGYDDQSGYIDSDQYRNNTTVSAAQSELANLGYYQGQIDGVEGDETQAALARYQQDRDLSATGTLTAATLNSMRKEMRSISARPDDMTMRGGAKVKGQQPPKPAEKKG